MSILEVAVQVELSFCKWKQEIVMVVNSLAIALEASVKGSSRCVNVSPSPEEFHCQQWLLQTSLNTKLLEDKSLVTLSRLWLYLVTAGDLMLNWIGLPIIQMMKGPILGGFPNVLSLGGVLSDQTTMLNVRICQ